MTTTTSAWRTLMLVGILLLALSQGGSSSSSSKDDNLLVSPIVNRELEASVVAHNWPSTPQSVFCEAYAYHCRDGLGAEFLDALVAYESNDSSDTTYESALQRVLSATPLQESRRSLLRVAVSMRAYSPQCELYRGLARETLWQQAPELLTAAADAFAVVNGRLVLPDQLDSFAWETVAAAVVVESGDDTPNEPSLLLPNESVIGSLGSTSDSGDKEPVVRVILYANMGSPTFAAAYQKLRQAKIPFVVRHLGAVGFEQDPSLATGTVLQGYGVRLDIRNVEYKVFDDRSDKKVSNQNDNLLVNKDLVAPPQFLAGVNLTALGLENDRELRTQLWSIHDSQATRSSIIPPVWRRRDMSLQAATAIVSSSSDDPLWTLQEVSQDLPSLASTLVHIPVPDEIRTAANVLQEVPLGQPGVVYINGRTISFNRPSFNVFELLSVLQEEQRTLKRMQDRLSAILPAAALKDVQRAWTLGKQFLSGPEDDGDEMGELPGQAKETPIRIDVARGWKKAVIYLNDMEKDAQYEGMSRSLRRMFYDMQRGMPPSVRRNLFTILAVMDPVNDQSSNSGLDLGMQLMKSGYPARVGLLLVDAADLGKCETFLSTETPDEGVPCPVEAVLDANMKEQQFGEIQAGAQVAHHMLAMAATDLVEMPGAFGTYAEYLTNFLQEGKEEGQSSSLNDLLSLHGTLYEGMGIESASTARSNAVKSLKAKDEDSQYGHALRFAVERSIKPGMSFLNGRPIPLDANEETIGQIFGQEQNHVFGLIMHGKITDTSPKSVYAELLTGPRVYKKSHPLIAGGGGDQAAYLDLRDSFDETAFLFPKAKTSSPQAVFVVDGFFDLSVDTGVALALKFISVMDSCPDQIGSTDVGIAYRVLPSSKDAAESPLCPLFAQASDVGSESLKSLLSDWNASTNLKDLLKTLKSLSSKTKTIILSEGSKDLCTGQVYLTESLPSKNFILGNGRYFPLDGAGLVNDDIDLLLSVEMDRSKAVTGLLDKHVSLKKVEDYSSIGTVVAYLSLEAESVSRKSISETISKLEDVGPLHMSWEGLPDAALQVHVIATIDPVSVAAQRLSPFLRMVRDELQLPLDLLLVPSPTLQGDSDVPITSYYRFLVDTQWMSNLVKPRAYFSNLPTNHVLTLRTDVPEPWDVQQTAAVQDTDNLRCDVLSGCGDDAMTGVVDLSSTSLQNQIHMTSVEYGLKSLLVFGQCYEAKGAPPNGLQLTIIRETDLGLQSSPTEHTMEVGADGSLTESAITRALQTGSTLDYSDTLVMKNVGYWQLRANPGLWKLSVEKDSKGATMFDMIDAEAHGGRLVLKKDSVPRNVTKTIVMKDFVNHGELLVVQRKPGVDEKTSIFYDERLKGGGDEDDKIHVFSLATGHLYERFLKIMMLSVTKRTSSKVKFWLFENFLSPTFKSSAKAMAQRIGCEVEFVTYKWPEWLRAQSEKQRIIWGYKILFLDVLFPLNVKKIIYVDADQVVRGDLKELWDMDLKGAPYGYTPFCSSRKETLGYQFWRDGFWKTHLRGKPYHISALYVVDLDLFRRKLVGDQLRSTYQQLSADPGSLSNLDQDLPNYAQHSVPIFSLPQEWLWCESWCSDESKAKAKTIDLCNNPMHKEPKVSMAKRVISGPLFEESWVELDAEVERYEQEFRQGQSKLSLG